MDLLDKYKKIWNNHPKDTREFSSEEIYKLAHSKSSSIVKWIFIIGLIEFVVLNSSCFFIDMSEALSMYKKMGLINFIYYSQIIFYIIVFYFLITFYKNYKKISTTDSIKTLMTKIIKTRKTVRNYVLFNLSYFVLIMIVVTIASINTNFDNLSHKEILIITIITIVITVLILAVLWLFYQLLYGILLRKLNTNYKKLADLNSEK